MTSPDPAFLTTKELADLLRIKERKVYDLASNGEVPCVRVVGKLLFPKDQIDAWIASTRSGPDALAPPPPIAVGSHDPLLDWALRNAGCGIAALFDGSLDGLSRFAAAEALLCSLHVHEPAGWNTATVAEKLGGRPVVLIEFARRHRGLIVAAGNPLEVRSIADVVRCRVARRQSQAASHILFEHLLVEAGIDSAALASPEEPERTEDDLAQAVLEGKADVAFGLAAAAHAHRLNFVPLLEERLDLLMWRRTYFEPPCQTLLGFLSSERFRDRAAEMPGYDISRAGTVHLNGA
ncbi:MAG: helix-turn-helix transcriptional regulator [Pseudomonadota bacterium]